MNSSIGPVDQIAKHGLDELPSTLVDFTTTEDKTVPISEKSYPLYLQQLEALNEVGRQLASAKTEQRVFNIVAAAAKRILGAARVSYVIPDFLHGTCKIIAMQGRDAIASDVSFPLPGSSIEYSATLNKTVFFDDLGDSPFTEHALLTQSGLTSAISVPIHKQQKVVGVLNAAVEITWSRPKEAQSLFSTLGRFLEAALQRLWAQEKTRSTMELLVSEANHDELTGLPNRSCFTKTLEKEIVEFGSKAKSFALLFIDLDNFKKINDTFSHSVGDQLLALISRRMEKEIRSEDLVARLGGDEFVVLLRNMDDLTEAESLALAFVEAIKRPYQIGERTVSVGASIGLSRFPTNGKTVAELMMHSDIAMYDAKYNGGNTCRSFTSKMAADIKQENLLSDDLDAALKNDELDFLYQPQISMETNKSVAIEALIRWNHPQRGWVSPGLFVPFAEKTGVITEITDLALNRALNSIAKLRKSHSNIYASVNISAVDFADVPALMLKIQNALAANDLPGSALELELTERVFLEYTAAAKAAIETWANDGIRLAIDDFGTGFSSLKYLLDLQIDTLKIDQSFTRAIDSNPRQRGIVKTILQMGNGLGATCVAEGVETDEELTCLRDLGCQVYQGFYGCRPSTLDDLAEFINR